MTKIKQLLSIACLLGLSSLDMQAYDVDFSYTYGDNDYEMFGTGKAETYDVAIFLSDPSLVGSKIKAFNVPFIESEGISDISVWATTELKIENKKNIPNLASVEATYSDGAINVTFPEMIEIPQGGVYVGYTFTVDKDKVNEINKYPVAIAGEPYEEGLYLHTTRTYLRWKSYAITEGKSSAITVTLDGDFYPNAVGVKSIKEPLSTPGEEIMLNANLLNHGSEPIKTIEYTVSDGENTQTNTVTFEPAKSLAFGQSFTANLPYVAPLSLNEYNLSINITKVNGEENNDASSYGETLLLVFNEVPVNRPLMEEYTGLWCGNCPRGFVAMEVMGERYPNEFVAIAYHNGDAMERITNFPSYVAGFPDAYLNRDYEVDPYFGDTNKGFGIEPLWQSIQEVFTPAIVNGSAKQAADGTIEVKSDISFVKSVPGTYKVAYAVIANGLQDPSWQQHNYFNDKSQYQPSDFIPEMEPFCNGPSIVTGLVFNDVFAAGSNLKGEASSLIENVKKDEIYSHTFKFAADEGMSMKGYDLFANAQELYAVIILLDNDGSVVNCNKVLVEDHTSGIDNLESDGLNVKTEFYDLNGGHVENPSNGIFLKVDTKENGEKTVSKTIIR